MQYVSISKKSPEASRVVLGCMRIGGMEVSAIDSLIKTALSCGINAFDHADIYGGGESEKRFGEALKLNPSIRENMFIQSKCGIRQGEYCFEKDYILSSVDGILKRLGTDYLDLLILHRPDVLMEPEEVAEAFDKLEAAGKVRAFGVSNMNPMQIRLLESALGEHHIAVNQMQLSCANTLPIDEGFNVNIASDKGTMYTGSVLEYCRLNRIFIQTWSTLQYGFFEGTFLNNDKFPELNATLKRIAKEHNVTVGAVAAAFNLRVPGVGQAIVGSTKPSRIQELAEAGNITLFHSEWYELYRSAGNKLP